MTPRNVPSAPYKKGKFLKAFADTGMVGKSAVLAGVNRKTVYRWRQTDQTFSKAFEEAKEEVLESLEAEAMRRAKDGVPVPIYHQGKEIGTIQKYSDLLLIFLLRALKPEKYRDNFGQSSETWTELDTRMSDAKASLAKKLERLCAQHPVSQGTPDPARLPSQGAQP